MTTASTLRRKFLVGLCLLSSKSFNSRSFSSFAVAFQPNFVYSQISLRNVGLKHRLDSSIIFAKRSLSMNSVPHSIKFTSYNVLSSHLSEPSYFTSCQPQYLSPDYRLQSLKRKLNQEIDENAVICLQEISTQWAGQLHSLFASRGYYMVTGLYGPRFNGYMGVAIAVPTAKFDIVDVDITRIGDTKEIPRSAKLGYIQNIVKKFTDFFMDIAIRLGVLQRKFNFWKTVTDRSNQMVCMRLQDKINKKSFVVGNYHMPCMFRQPSVMVAHCALSAQHIQKFAESDPFIYAGDFNIKPSSSQYELLTNGVLPEKHEDYPEPIANDSWKPFVQPPLKSAYVTYSGTEPDFTNYAKIKDDPMFIETLDYLFHSDGWEVESVKKLPMRDEVSGPLPNENEPSDHIAISAVMKLK